MKKHNDQDFSGIAFASFDHRSAAFRQKMFEHFQANSPKHCRTIEKLPDTQRKHQVIYFRENV